MIFPAEAAQTATTRIKRLALAGLLTLSAGTLGGCTAVDRIADGVGPGPHDVHTSYHDNHELAIAYPDVASCGGPAHQAAASASQPFALEDPSTIPALEMELAEAVRLAITQSPVLRDIGGTVVRNPTTTQTIYNPGLTASGLAGQNLGTEAALSQFDANYSQQLFWNNTDQPQNINFGNFAGGGAGAGNPTAAFFAPFTQSRGATFANELSKTTATGARFAISHQVNYLKTQDPSVATRLFESSFIGFIQGEYRQPLMQGGGVLYNQIAGPDQFQVNQGIGRSPLPGQYNGVLIARINEDISLADFEQSVISTVADVEQAYWDLAEAYRLFAANVAGRESAQRSFQFQTARLEVGTGQADEEAQARSQFFQFQAQVESSLGGPMGVYALEQRLRYLIGMPATDGRLIKPVTPPNDIKVVFDWQEAVGQALDRRVEVRRQAFQVKRREFELIAARLNRKPRVDLLAQYRWRGLGDHLIGESNRDFDNLYGNITQGNYQEGQLGVEMAFPVGLRLASVAVANAKLNLTRERALLDETQLRVSHDLSDAGRQIDLTYQLLETNYNRFQADIRQVEVLRRRYRDGSENINFLLQAQRQVVTSESAFYSALFDYQLAIRDFHRQKGSLLAYNEISLAEGAWPVCASRDAHTIGRYLQPRPCPGEVCTTPPVSRSGFDPSATMPTAVVPELIIDPNDEVETIAPGRREKEPNSDSATETPDQTPESIESGEGKPEDLLDL